MPLGNLVLELKESPAAGFDVRPGFRLSQEENAVGSCDFTLN